MPIDKFGRMPKQKQQFTNETTAAISLTQMNDTFLRRDGRNTVFGTINMTGNTLTNVSNPVHDYDAANKVYVDENAGISKTGDTMLGDLNMNNNRLTGLPPGEPQTGRDAVSWSQAVLLTNDVKIHSVKKTGDLMTGNLILSAYGGANRIFGCSDLEAGRAFTLMLGTSTNKLYFRFRREPIVLYTDNGFLVKAEAQNICRLGTADEIPEIIIYKNIRMNSNRLTNLPAPTLPHEAANKLYVDGTPRKVLQGYIPPLMASGRAFGKLVLNDKFGFVVTASSFHNNLFHPINAFNGLYAPQGGRGEWASKNEHQDFWIQIKCPHLVRLWSVALRGRESNTERITERIYKWKLEGSTDGNTYTVLYETPNPTFIGDDVRYFPIETNDKLTFLGCCV